MRILILGGNGFIGTHLTERLVREQHTVTILARTKGFRGGYGYLDDKVDWIINDYSSITDFSEMIQDVDYIIHLISTTSPGSSNLDPTKDISTNVLPAIQLLNAVKESNVKKIVYISSGGTIYGVPEKIPVREEHPTNPICSYGIHKLAIEKYLYLYKYNYGINFNILRVSNPFGLMQLLNPSLGAVSNFINKVLIKEPIEIWGDGEVVRDFVYIEDVVSAIIKSMNYEGVVNTFNIGSGNGYSLNQVTSLVFDAVGYEVPVRYTPQRSFDVQENILDINKAFEYLNWRPNYSIEQALKHYLNQLER